MSLEGSEPVEVEMKPPRPKVQYMWFRKYATTFSRLDLQDGKLAWIDHALPQYIETEGFHTNSVVIDADAFCNIMTCFEAIPFAKTMSLRRKQLRERLDELEKLMRPFPALRSMYGPHGGRGLDAFRNGRTVAADTVIALAKHASLEYFEELAAPEPAVGKTVYTAVHRLYTHLQGQKVWRRMSEDLLERQEKAWAAAAANHSDGSESPYRRRRLSSEITQGFLCPNCHLEVLSMDVLVEHVKECQPTEQEMVEKDTRTFWHCVVETGVRNKPRGWSSYVTRQMCPGEEIVEIEKAELATLFRRRQTWISFSDSKDSSEVRWVIASEGHTTYMNPGRLPAGGIGSTSEATSTPVQAPRKDQANPTSAPSKGSKFFGKSFLKHLKGPRSASTPRSKSMVATPVKGDDLVRRLSGLVGGGDGERKWLGSNDEEERIRFLETLAKMQVCMCARALVFRASLSWWSLLSFVAVADAAVRVAVSCRQNFS